MTFNEYQKLAQKTARYPNVGNNFIYPTLGMIGEAGEVANKIQKIIRDDSGSITEEKKKEIASELGDVLWFLSQMAVEFDISLDEVARLNLEKLASRAKRGQISGSGDDR